MRNSNVKIKLILVKHKLFNIQQMVGFVNKIVLYVLKFELAITQYLIADICAKS